MLYELLYELLFAISLSTLFCVFPLLLYELVVLLFALLTSLLLALPPTKPSNPTIAYDTTPNITDLFIIYHPSLLKNFSDNLTLLILLNCLVFLVILSMFL